jgi:hypothetical protein
MKAIVKLTDKIEVEIEEKDEMETLHKAIVLTHPRTRCDACGNTENFYLVSNKDTEGNTYVNYKCGKCKATSKLGQYKAGGYFWREYEEYVPKDKAQV